MQLRNRLGSAWRSPYLVAHSSAIPHGGGLIADESPYHAVGNAEQTPTPTHGSKNRKALVVFFGFHIKRMDEAFCGTINWIRFTRNISCDETRHSLVSLTRNVVRDFLHISVAVVTGICKQVCQPSSRSIHASSVSPTVPSGRSRVRACVALSGSPSGLPVTLPLGAGVASDIR